MVDHYYEGACQVLPQKASPVSISWASTDNVQRIHSESTLSIAPCTPMQASAAWHKPPHESPESLPSLSLGTASSELKGSTPISHSLLHQALPTRPVAAGSLGFSKPNGSVTMEVQREGHEYHREDLIPFSLSMCEKRYQAAHKSDLCNILVTCGGFQPSPQHMQAAAAGVYKSGSSSEMHSSSAWQSFDSHKDTVDAGLKLLTARNPPQLGKSLNALALLVKDAHDVKSDPGLGKAPSLYPPAPGDVANNAYKLYSEMFSSSPAATTACLSPPTQTKGGLQPYPEHKDAMRLLPVMYHDKQLKAISQSNHINDRSAKKPKCREDTPLSLVVVKQEPDVEPDTKACHAISFGSPCVARHSLENGEAKISLPWQECLVHDRDWIDSKHFDQHHPTICSCPKSTNAINAIPSSEDLRCQLSALDTTTTMKNVQHLDGVNLIMPSECAHRTESWNTFSLGGTSAGVLSQSTTTVSNGVGEATPHGRLSTEADWGKFLALSATPVVSPAETALTSVLPCQKRFEDLQAFLKRCDEADPSEGMQALRSLSAAARSGYAVELETRAIRLSLEEGKEMKRMRLLNVLGKNPERSLDDAGATPQGPRLPAPGATSNVKNIV